MSELTPDLQSYHSQPGTITLVLQLFNQRIGLNSKTDEVRLQVVKGDQQEFIICFKYMYNPCLFSDNTSLISHWKPINTEMLVKQHNNELSAGCVEVHGM